MEAGPRASRQEWCDAGNKLVGFLSVAPRKTKLAEHIAEQDGGIGLGGQKIRRHSEEIAFKPSANTRLRMQAAKEQLRPRVRVDGHYAVETGQKL
jgi:hypothetical protein